MSNKIKALFSSFETAERKLDMHFGNETSVRELQVISTGSPLLDDCLSCGGIPRGRCIQVFGPAGSGKTLLTLIMIKNAQKEDENSIQVYFDAENAFDNSWMSRLGIDVSRVLIIDSETAAYGREAFELLLGVPKQDAKTHAYTGQATEGILDKVISGELNCNMIVYDSLGEMQPPGEDVSYVGKSNIALLSRFLTPVFRKLSLAVSRANVCFVCINHKRDNMDTYSQQKVFSGGNTYSHSLSANIYVERIQRKDAAVLDNNDEIIGNLLRCEIIKSKFGPWPKKCEITVDFNKGIIDIHKEIAELALKYDIVTKPTSMSYEYGDQKWVGMNKFQEAIRDDQALADKLMAEVVETRRKKAANEVEDQAKAVEEVVVKATKGRPKKSAN